MTDKTQELAQTMRALLELHIAHHNNPTHCGARALLCGLLDDAPAAADPVRDAAPELLAALRFAAESLEQFVKLGRIPANNQGLRDARAAIAKAEGR